MNPSRADRLQTFAWAAAGIALIGLFWLLGPILAPFVIGAVFAYICDPAVNWMVARRVPRALAVLLVIVALGLLLVALALVLVLVGLVLVGPALVGPVLMAPAVVGRAVA